MSWRDWKALLAVVGVITLIPPPALAARARSVLPPGPERTLVRRYCNVCHSLNRIAKGHGTEAGWEDRLHRMIRFGATLPKKDIPKVATYLAKAFPPRRPPADTDLSDPSPEPPASAPAEGGAS